MWLQAADVFAKTAEEARIRTRGGGTVTILAGIIIIWLLILEIRSYMTIEFSSQLSIDTLREQQLPVVFDVSFFNVPCDLLNVDSMDDMGNIQENLDSMLQKEDLDANGNPLGPEHRQRQERERDEAIARRTADYEGPCYGAGAEGEKCMTCDDVRKAYAQKNWKFHDGHGFQQCVEERYPEHVLENKDNGCRISGKFSVAKAMGKIHIAPGQSFFADGRHSHDLSTYDNPELPYNFAHRVNQLSFGDHSKETPLEDPLKEHDALTDVKHYVFRYFLKVVATEVVFRDDTSVNTNQYSVTLHESPTKGGRDDDHPHSFHSTGVMPGVWFNYDISPMKVTDREVRQQTFPQMMMNIFAIVGAVVTTGAVVDRGVYAVNKALQQRKDR